MPQIAKYRLSRTDANILSETSNCERVRIFNFIHDIRRLLSSGIGKRMTCEPHRQLYFRIWINTPFQQLMLLRKYPNYRKTCACIYSVCIKC